MHGQFASLTRLPSTRFESISLECEGNTLLNVRYMVLSASNRGIAFCVSLSDSTSSLHWMRERVHPNSWERLPCRIWLHSWVLPEEWCPCIRMLLPHWLAADRSISHIGMVLIDFLPVRVNASSCKPYPLSIISLSAKRWFQFNNMSSHLALRICCWVFLPPQIPWHSTRVYCF